MSEDLDDSRCLVRAVGKLDMSPRYPSSNKGSAYDGRLPPGLTSWPLEVRKNVLVLAARAHGALPNFTQVVTRLTEQKGLPLILHGLRVAQQAGAQFCVLGSAPEAAVQQHFDRWAAELAGGTAGRLVLRHDEALAHRIYAGADAILIPSFFEPCGLTQLIALRSVRQRAQTSLAGKECRERPCFYCALSRLSRWSLGSTFPLFE